MKIYKSYMFRSKDPTIDELRTIIQREMNGKAGADRNKALKLGMKQIEENGGPQVSTMRGWFFGKTQRPQSATMEAAGRSLGYKREWVKQ